MANTVTKMLKYCENYKVFHIKLKVFPEEKADTETVVI